MLPSSSCEITKSLVSVPQVQLRSHWYQLHWYISPPRMSGFAGAFVVYYRALHHIYTSLVVIQIFVLDSTGDRCGSIDDLGNNLVIH